LRLPAAVTSGRRVLRRARPAALVEARLPEVPAVDLRAAPAGVRRLEAVDRAAAPVEVRRTAVVSAPSSAAVRAPFRVHAPVAARSARQEASVRQARALPRAAAYAVLRQAAVQLDAAALQGAVLPDVAVVVAPLDAAAVAEPDVGGAAAHPAVPVVLPSALPLAGASVCRRDPAPLSVAPPRSVRFARAMGCSPVAWPSLRS
jgi:hypothetical protein